MCEIEAILNSRPLAPLTDDDDELMAITPAMLLTGFKHRLFPVLAGRKPAQLAVSKDPVQRYRYLQSLITKFWYDWKSSYLALLQTRQKFLKNVPNVTVGELVLLQEDNSPPTKWPLARILEVYPGKDGVVRAVKLRTSTTELDRPVIRLRRLPIALQSTADCNQSN